MGAGVFPVRVSSPFEKGGPSLSGPRVIQSINDHLGQPRESATKRPRQRTTGNTNHQRGQAHQIPWSRQRGSYLVDSNENQHNRTSAQGLKAGYFKFWCQDDTPWLGSHPGDFYSHEAFISHVRLSLSTKFAKSSLGEIRTQRAARVKKIDVHMNLIMKCQTLGKAWARDCCP